jgi:hypothetical protein
VKVLSYTLTGLVYGLCLTALGWNASGAGHGTFFFLSLAVFPYGLGFLLWPAIALLLAKIDDGFYRDLFLSVIAVRYALIAVFVVNWGEVQRIPIAWMYTPGYILEWILIFLAGQVLIWVLFVRKVNRRG